MEIEKNLFMKRVAEKLGINQELLKKEIHKKEVQLKPKSGSQKQTIKIHIDPVEVHLIQLLLEYPQKTSSCGKRKGVGLFSASGIEEFGRKNC